MSILETPRILFRGNMSWDPIVTNNDPSYYNEKIGESDLPGTAHIPPQATAAYQRVLGFRAEAIADQGVWNPQGTHRSSFFDLGDPDPSCPSSSILASEVSGVDLGAGPVTGDPFVGVPAQFTGMLVDLEPYGTNSSQLFFDSMSFGIAGGCRIYASRFTRAVGRYINFNRNGQGAIAGIASVIWQTSFRTQDLVIDAFDSAALQALQQALDGAGVLGLSVRWSTYRTIYYDTPSPTNGSPALQQAANALEQKLTLKNPYGNGVFQPNPARSKFVGAIGLWREGEPACEPGDRALLPVKLPGMGTPAPVAAFARLGEGSVTLDLGNTVPEVSLDLTKQNLQDLTLKAVLPTSPPSSLPIATLTYADYNREAYEAGSGIVTKPVDRSSFPDNAVLQLWQAQTLLLQEAPTRVIPIVPNLYVDEGQPGVARFQIYVNGSLGGGGTGVTLLGVAPNNKIVSQDLLTADPSGVVSMDLPTGPAGILAYIPLLKGQSLGNGLNTQVNTYMYVRRLPADAETAALPPTWDNVYTSVLANWNAMAPCMDNWLDLYDEMQVRNYGAVLKKLTDPAHFEGFRFMPVTRDMTPGERTLLYNFLDAPPSATEAPGFRAEGAQGGDEAEPDFAAQSRAMRNAELSTVGANKEVAEREAAGPSEGE